MIKNLKYVFDPKNIAIIGASPKTGKIGNVVLKTMLSGAFRGKIFPVNIKHKEILGLKAYKSILDIKENIDLAIIITPAKTVPKIIEECGKKGVKGTIVLSSGFGEVGNKDLENELIKMAKKYNIALVGPNCIGIYNPKTDLDSVFMPIYRSKRPNVGRIAIITQSGSTGTSILDILAEYNIGISKFISYGNGSVLDESDYLEYLENDEDTKVIIMYLEGAKNGRKLYERLKSTVKKKPVIILKSGKYGKASKAAKSHTGNIAGDYLAYEAAFKQTKTIEANGIRELIDFVKIFEQPCPKGDKIGIITNGGGMGVLTADATMEVGLKIAELSEESKKELKKILPPYGNVGNPQDLIADADVERYKKAIDIFMNDPNVDAIVVDILFQVPSIDDRILNVLIDASNNKKKPIAVVSLGGSYTENRRRILESQGVPSYQDPLSALKALKKLVDYSKYKSLLSKDYE